MKQDRYQCRSQTLGVWHLMNPVSSLFLYSARIQSVGPLKALYTLPPDSSFRHQLDFFWKQSSHAAITSKDCSLIFPPPSISSTYLYSWVDWGIAERKKMPRLWNGRDSNLGSLDCESRILPLSRFACSFAFMNTLMQWWIPELCLRYKKYMQTFLENWECFHSSPNTHSGNKLKK